MAILQVDFMSESLMRTVPLKVILPADKLSFPGQPKREHKPFKTLYLLHGVFGSHIDWITGTNIMKWAEEKDLAVVMPAGENMFYVDQEAGHNYYGEYIGKELPEITRKMFPLSPEREDTFIGGLSMGGYGALRNGLKYCENFGCIAAMSSALIIDGLEDRTDDIPLFIETRAYAERVFGELSRVKDSDKNPKWLAEEIASEKKSFPKIYMACGESDSLLAVNREMQDALRKAGADVTYEESPGGHEWDYWNQTIKRVLDWLPLDGSESGMNSGNVGI